MTELPKRKNIRLKGYDYSQNGAYFITLCTKDRQNLLGRIVVGDGILDAPRSELSEYGIKLCEIIDFVNQNSRRIAVVKYVIMPNHVHLIVTVTNPADGASGKPRPTSALIPTFVSSIKRYANKQAGFNLWQRSYHDRIIRDEAEALRIGGYIDTNPAAWPEDEYYTAP